MRDIVCSYLATRVSSFVVVKDDRRGRDSGTHNTHKLYSSRHYNCPHRSGVIRSACIRVRCVILYFHPIGLHHVKHPHESFLTVLVITGVPSRGDQTYSVGLHKLAPQQFIARGRDRQGLEENLNVSHL